MKVQFYIDAVKDDDASRIQGYDVYREVEKVKISGFIHGDNQLDTGQIIDTVASAQHKARFPEHYRRFKLEQKETTVGTPLKMWPAISIADVRTLSSLGITTIEQLAEVEAKELRQHEWLKPLHQKAVTWLKSLADNGEVLRLEARIADLEGQVAERDAAYGELLKSIAESKKRTAKTSE